MSSLIEGAPEGIDIGVEQAWEEIEMVVDSGATDTVVGENMLQCIETTPGPAFKRGVH